jgi:hypothetical protein
MRRSLLLEFLGESLKHDSCEAIRGVAVAVCLMVTSQAVAALT